MTQEQFITELRTLILKYKNAQSNRKAHEKNIINGVDDTLNSMQLCYDEMTAMGNIVSHCENYLEI